MSIQKEKQKRARQLLSKKNVVSIGVGKKVRGGVQTDEPAIIIGVKEKLPPEKLRRKDLVPQKLGRYQTDVQEVGEIRLLDAVIQFPKYSVNDVNTGRMRPARPGCSIGHIDITAGTMGAVVRDRKNNKRAILSNNHVLCNVNKGKKGDLILQPGAYDGGKYPADLIATLERFVEIKMPSGCWLIQLIRKLFKMKAEINEVDCALASPMKETEASANIIDIGIPTTGVFEEPMVGMTVIKSGRTTGLTEGKVTQTNAMLRVVMGDAGEVAIFDEQFIVQGTKGGFSAPGDSGSLILSLAKEPVGLLFAGSDTITVGNEIVRVMNALDVDFEV